MVPAAAAQSLGISSIRGNLNDVFNVLMERGMMDSELIQDVVQLYVFDKEETDNGFEKTAVSELRAKYQKASEEKQQLIQDLFAETIATMSGAPIDAELKKRIEEAEKTDLGMQYIALNVPSPLDLIRVAEAFSGETP